MISDVQLDSRVGDPLVNTNCEGTGTFNPHNINVIQIQVQQGTHDTCALIPTDTNMQDHLRDVYVINNPCILSFDW